MPTGLIQCQHVKELDSAVILEVRGLFVIQRLIDDCQGLFRFPLLEQEFSCYAQQQSVVREIIMGGQQIFLFHQIFLILVHKDDLREQLVPIQIVGQGARQIGHLRRIILILRLLHSFGDVVQTDKERAVVQIIERRTGEDILRQRQDFVGRIVNCCHPQADEVQKRGINVLAEFADVRGKFPVIVFEIRDQDFTVIGHKRQETGFSLQFFPQLLEVVYLSREGAALGIQQIQIGVVNGLQIRLQNSDRIGKSEF